MYIPTQRMSTFIQMILYDAGDSCKDEKKNHQQKWEHAHMLLECTISKQKQ